MKPDIRAEFRISGNQMTPEEITDFLGIVPTRTMNLGDPIPRTIMKVKANIWCLSIEMNEKPLELSSYINPIIDFLFDKRELISKLRQEKGLHCEILCAIYIIDETPIIYLDSEIMSMLSELNIDLDMDLILTANTYQSYIE